MAAAFNAFKSDTHLVDTHSSCSFDCITVIPVRAYRVYQNTTTEALEYRQ